MKRLFASSAFLFALIGLSVVYAGEYGGSIIGPGVSEHNGNKLQWEEGSHDYFTMFKTLLWNPDPANDNGGQNPSADKCLTESTFVVQSGDLPEDAYVEAAYLIWASAIDPDKVFGNADSTVTLTYNQQDGYVGEVHEVSVQGYSATNKTDQDFEFQAIYIPAADTGSVDAAYFTYRADITDFFTMVHTKAREAGAPYDGAALIGSYKLSNMDCSEHEYYATNAYNGGNSIMVGGWSIILVYRSESITPKKIYFYHGFDMYNMQEIDITVGGFEFPDKPVVRLSLMVNEGDPGLAIASHTACGTGGMFGAPCPPEGLQVKGQTAAQWAPLFDDCNPLKQTDSQGTAFTYTEMYNCISSFYGWDDDSPTCIGGDPNAPDPVKLEYSMDVDTMLLNGEFYPFNEHFKKDDTSFMLKIGANGDMIFTNLLVLSVDTRASKYDIPVNPKTPNGREKHYCSCSPIDDTVCSDRPFYYTVKIQNWGDEFGENVTLQDALPAEVDYVAGSTEIARAFDANGNGTDWTAIPDGAGGAFPFTTAAKVADVIGYCDAVSQQCDDTILLRFKVQPKNGLPKNTVIENTAIINDTANLPYYTNTTVPLRLRFGNCPSPAECPEPAKAQCGGEGQNNAQCQNNEDCGAGKKCDNGQCVADTAALAANTAIEFALGKNSPANGSSIYIPAPATGLVAGQFTLKAMSPGNNGKVFSFDDVKVKFTLSSAQIQLGGITLVRDLNGNGIRDAEDTVLATANGLSAGYADFVIPINSRAFPVNTLHYFLVVTDAAFTGPTIPANSTFKGEIENSDSLIVSDAGTPTVKENNVTFATFAFDPSQGSFLFTKGPNDPTVKAPADMKNALPLMQIRAVSPGQANTIERITLKTATGSVRYGEGIAKISLWLDTDGNGVGDSPIASMPPYDAGDSSVEFELATPISFSAGETKYLVFTGELSLSGSEKAIIEVPKSGVDLGTTAAIVELPVRSREFTVLCDPLDTTCTGQNGDGDDDIVEEDTACGCSVVGEGGGTGNALFLLLAGLLLAARRFSRS